MSSKVSNLLAMGTRPQTMMKAARCSIKNRTVFNAFILVIMPGRPQLSSIVSKTHAPAQTMMNASMQTFMGFRFPVITLYLE